CLFQDVEATTRALQLRHPDGRRVATSELPIGRALCGEASRISVQFWNPREQRYSYASVGGAPIRDGRGEVVGVVSVGSDVTEAMELDRLKDEFIRVIAHELKTPITIMKGNAQVLAQTLGPELGEVHARMLQAICRGVERVNRIMCELLDAQQ